MIRWYDYIVAFAFSDLLVTTLFTIPMIGAIIAYTMYEFGWDYYCQFRLEQENK